MPDWQFFSQLFSLLRKSMKIGMDIFNGYKFLIFKKRSFKKKGSFYLFPSGLFWEYCSSPYPWDRAEWVSIWRIHNGKICILFRAPPLTMLSKGGAYNAPRLLRCFFRKSLLVHTRFFQSCTLLAHLYHFICGPLRRNIPGNNVNSVYSCSDIYTFFQINVLNFKIRGDWLMFTHLTNIDGQWRYMKFTKLLSKKALRKFQPQNAQILQKVLAPNPLLTF